ncbi:hypothetical protein [Reyranella sp. CPCC 100927]|uniref:hypothetical protein n=1 Tax=Reyranella sp. CPCC 100927 TaxID=2599616 RepID=UPI0011B3D179|nr:hypothetical protein [Reyranella sp. CPCC 100927]TWS99692.1 hypothetical protein FQU96_35055 [Reyranella sp. CPCC 100927]
MMLYILKGPACQQINFSMPGVTISGLSFAWVANAIQQGTIGVVIEAQKPGAGASYKPDPDQFSLPHPTFGVAMNEMAAIVHESVHAWVDLTKTSTSRVTNELCAYLAGAMFREYMHEKQPQDPPTFKVAGLVAQRLIARNDRTVRRDEIEMMRIELQRRPIYADIFKPGFEDGANGVRGNKDF